MKEIPKEVAEFRGVYQPTVYNRQWQKRERKRFMLDSGPEIVLNSIPISVSGNMWKLWPWPTSYLQSEMSWLFLWKYSFSSKMTSTFLLVLCY